MRNISPSNRKPSAAGSGFRTEDLWVTCRPPYPLCHSGYPIVKMCICISDADDEDSDDKDDDADDDDDDEDYNAAADAAIIAAVEIVYR